jgi:outer membrane protein TolC
MEARADGLNAEFQLRSITADAEVAYWAMVVARSAVLVQEDALKSAEGINTYTQKRKRMNLGDEADALQSVALFESRRLEFKRATDAERSAQRRFNALRNEPVNTPIAPLESINAIVTRPMVIPDGARADVLAAQAEAELAQANARRQAESDKPTLEAYGSYAMNGRDDDASGSLSDSYSADRPTASAGLRFAVPLDVSALRAARRGVLTQAEAAKTRVEQLKLDEQSDRADLAASLVEAQEQLRLSIDIAAAQKRKLEHERQRLRSGRTNTYQVLLFEQDYSQSELARVLAGRSLLSLLAQMRLYILSDDRNAL